MSRIRSAFPALVLAASLGSVPAWAETLADAMKLAYQTNPQLVNARANLRGIDEGVAQARADLRPQVSASGTISKSRNISSNLTGEPTLNVQTGITQQLYDGGRTKELIEAARLNVLATRQGLINIEQQILLEVVTQYMNVRRDMDIVRLSENNVKVLREQLRAARDRFDVGEVTRTDVSQTEAQLAAAQSGLQLNRANLKASNEAYRTVVGKLPSNLGTPPKAPKLPSSAKRAEAIALKRHPQIIQAQLQQQRAERALAAANLNKKGTLSAGIRLQRNAQRGVEPTDSITGSITGQVPIYSGGSLKSQRRQQLAAVDQAKANVQLQAVTVRANVNRVYNNWVALRSAIGSSRKQVRAAQIAFDGIQEEAKLGARTTLDTLTAEQTLLNARTNLVSSIRDEYVAAYAVLAEMGMLTTDQIGLSVERYNPDVNYSAVNAKSGQNRKFKLLDKLQSR